MREILFVAGEVSGDLHASGVVRALRASGTALRLTGVGGDRMRDAGLELIKHSGELSVMGFVEPLKKLPAFRRLRADITRRLRSGNVALVILVDYAGFNMKIAAAAKDAGVPVLYFITPQVWASRAGRLSALARTVTKAAVILPFEEKLLRDHGVDATFVGHPLIEGARDLPDRASARKAIGVDEGAPLLVLFPGSRAQEIAMHLDAFVETARELQRRTPGLEVVVSAAPYVRIPAERCPFPLVHAASFALLRAADAALCKSGTTTLEAAVALCPLVVAYRTDRLSYAIGKRIIRIPFIGLVNVLAGRMIVPEFVQEALVPARVADALKPLLERDGARRAAMVAELERVRDMLGDAGAAGRVADMALRMIADAPGAAA